MPLIKSKSKPAFKQNVRTLMGEVGKSPHVQSRAQALAIAYSTARRAKKKDGGKVIKGGAIDRLPEDRLSSNIEDRRGERQGSWREERRQAIQDQADAADMRNALIFGAKSGRTFSRAAYADGGEVSEDPFERAAMRLRQSVRPEEGRREGLATQVPVRIGEDIGRAAQRLSSLPQRAMTSAANYERTGEYDPAPIVEAAGMVVGSPLTPRGALGSSAKLPPNKTPRSAASAVEESSFKRGADDAISGRVATSLAEGPVGDAYKRGVASIDAALAHARYGDLAKLPSRMPIEGEVLSPSTAVAARPKSFDWTPALLDVGYHPLQLRNMTAQQIEAAGRKVVETRLGPMLPALKELGYTPQELINMNPAEAYKAIKGKIISGTTEKAGGGGVKIAAQTTTAPWYQRSALRNMTRGAGGVFRMPGVAALRKQYALGGMPTEDRLAGSGPGRTDNKPINVKSGSYIIPADIVSGLGQGNTLAGKEKIGKMFSGAKVNRYGGGKFRMPGVPGMRRGQFAYGGVPKTVPIIAADGEHEVQPHEAEQFRYGGKQGHDALDAWVLDQRKKNIKDLRRLKPPRKN